MKQKIATLEVYVSDEFETCCVASHPHDDSRFALVIPKEEKMLKEKGIVDTVKVRATIIAHELGHFLGKILRSPWQACPWKVPGEIEAWDLAALINPKCDQSIKELALSTYTDAKPGEYECHCGRGCNNVPPKELQKMYLKLYEKTKLV